MAEYTAKLDYPDESAPAVEVYCDGALISTWAGWNASVGDAHDWLNQDFRLMMGDTVERGTDEFGRWTIVRLEEI